MGILPLLQPPRIEVCEDDQPYYPALRGCLNVLFAFYGKAHMLNLFQYQLSNLEKKIVLLGAKKMGRG